MTSRPDIRMTRPAPWSRDRPYPARSQAKTAAGSWCPSRANASC